MTSFVEEWHVLILMSEISDPSTRSEMQRYAREEFERCRDVTDIVRWQVTILLIKCY